MSTEHIAEKKTYGQFTEEVLKEIREILGERNVSLDPEKRQTYSFDQVPRGHWENTFLCDVVVFPETTEQIAALLALANRLRIPVTPRGAGTGLSGGAIPLHGGIVLSTEKMNRILELDEDNLTITVEPGVVTAEITKAARAAGLLYAGDPCSGDASFIGGNVAENAGGNKVVKYGSTGASVLALEVVLADGSVTWFGGKRRKDVTGYDFVHLLAGSEGTLGIITKIILRLLPLPTKVVDLLVPFPDTDTAVAFVPKIMIEGKVIPASIEFLDRSAIRLVEDYLSTCLPHGDAGAHLIIQLEGNDPETLADEYERIGELCFRHGAMEVFVADNRNVRDKLWKARKAVGEAMVAGFVQSALEDVVVPTSAVPELMREATRITKTHGVEGINFGHIGDGNMHVNFVIRKPRADWHEVMDRALRDLYRTVRRLGGTLSGEHGIGLKRREYMEEVMDAAQIALIRRVKQAFDPNNILNPGKIVPDM
jgi:glycolate oxidase